MSDNTFPLLTKLIGRIQCKPGWSFYLVHEDHEGGDVKRLVISVSGHDSYNPNNPLTISHFFPVPIATYNEKTWRRWIFEMCRRVENHELGEWFRVGDVRPFAPLHGPGEDPYTVHEFRPETDAQTIQDGTVYAEKIKT